MIFFDIIIDLVACGLLFFLVVDEVKTAKRGRDLLKEFGYGD